MGAGLTSIISRYSGRLLRLRATDRVRCRPSPTRITSDDSRDSGDVC